jgi:hypothetical protein
MRIRKHGNGSASVVIVFAEISVSMLHNTPRDPAALVYSADH